MMKLTQLTLLAAALLPVSLLAQTPVASVHGHVTNAAGLPLTKGEIRLTTDKSGIPKERKYKNVFQLDANGDFKGTGIVPGDYVAFIASGTTDSVDYQDVTFRADEDKVLNFDMSRKEYLDAMSPADKAALEEYKTRAAAAIKANSVVANLNNALRSVNEDLKAANPNFDQDRKTMLDATAQKADEAVLWYNLGAVDVADANAKVKTAKAAHQPWQSDETIIKTYNDGIDAYKKGLALNDTAKKPNPADAGVAWNSIGNSEAALGKLPEAQEAFDNAVKLAPATAGMVYGNEAAVLFNANQSDAAAVAADKAIAAEPTRPDPYYIKGQSLIAKSTVDTATGKIQSPPGCVEAYQKYLELAPDGPHAAEVKEVLAGLGQNITTSYKAPGKTSGKAVKVPPAK